MGGVGPRVYDRCVLRRLRIENLVLIREAELELAPGLNAITGETGAGKTILAQAFGLLLGAKGDDSYVGAAAEEAYVEAELDLPDGARGARRSCGPRTRMRSSSRAASSPTAGRARTRGAEPPRERTSPPPSSAWSRCRASSSSAVSRGRPTSSRCSTASAGRSSSPAAPLRGRRGATFTPLAAGTTS